MARGYEPFSNCRRCGNRILWVKTLAGKNMPVDPNLINYRVVPGGKDCYAERGCGSRRAVQSGRSRWSGIYFPLRNLREVRDDKARSVQKFPLLALLILRP